MGLGIQHGPGHCESTNGLFSKQGDVVYGRNGRNQNRGKLVGPRDSTLLTEAQLVSYQHLLAFLTAEHKGGNYPENSPSSLLSRVWSHGLAGSPRAPPWDTQEPLALFPPGITPSSCSPYRKHRLEFKVTHCSQVCQLCSSELSQNGGGWVIYQDFKWL